MAIVLIHGAWVTSGIWDACRAHLDAPHLAVDLAGCVSDSAGSFFDNAVRATIAQMDSSGVRSATVVAHSLGGIVACVLAERFAARVDSLVFVSAHIPASHEAPVASLSLALRAMVEAQQRANARTLEFPEPALPVALNDCTQEQIEFVRPRLRAQQLTAFIEPVAVSRLDAGLGCKYVKLTRDQIHAPPMQDMFIARLPNCEVITLDAGHCAMVSRPRELARLIEQ
jgi:pimeloyl-ACP methyl ester carboxylesterase